MPRSIATRTFHIVLLSTLLSLCLSLGFAWWGLENLELTMLEAENQTEIEYFHEYGDKSTPQRVNTAQMISLYLPNNLIDHEELPLIFRGLSVPYQGEVELLGTDYIVITHAFPEGRFYIAKNLQLFEEREEALIINVLILSTTICMIAFLLALLASRNISRPIVQLTTQLRQLDSVANHARLRESYQDSELKQISSAINHYLQRLDESIKRERSLISMASHELKTPIAVVLGATHVLESRNQLEANDQKTLRRIKDAAQDMSNNISALLNLARQTQEAPTDTVCWSELLDSIHQGYQLQDAKLASRLTFIRENSKNEITSNQALVKMLLHNLINNALNYTQGNVVVHLDDTTLTITDQGAGFTDSPENAQPQSSGLGLFIVNLICRQLHWNYEINSSAQGTSVSVHLATAE